MTQTGIFKGRVQIPYAYGRYGWTRGGGSTMVDVYLVEGEIEDVSG